MLKQLLIKNAAIIAEQRLDFGPGLNVLSGETGAGKSILLDCLNFALGCKADRELIRYGEETMTVRAVFEIDDQPELRAAMEGMGLEWEEVLILSRSFSRSGRGEIHLNGQPAALSMLKQLSGLLIDIYGQSEHVSLLKVSNHIKLLDAFCREELDPLRQRNRALLADYRQITEELGKFGGSEAERARLIDLYAFQLEEISEAALREGEEEKLQEQRVLLQNAEKIRAALSEARAALSGDYGVIGNLGSAHYRLNQVSRFDPELEALSEKLNDLKFEAEDLADRLEQRAGDFEFDERSADRIEDRLELIKRLKKKYGSGIPEILAYADQISEELEKLKNADAEIAGLTERLGQILARLEQNFRAMRKIRQGAAARLEEKITGELRQLNMPSARFVIAFGEEPKEAAGHLSAEGWDSLEFLLSANKGEPLKPLSKVISGGEMSRFMLAVKTVTAELDDLETLVFDEIDAGISGQTAGVLAQKLERISRTRQVICITHSPAIAAMGDRNFLITKTETADKTVSQISLLNEEGLLAEIARLTGAVVTGEHALRHAADLRAWAAREKAGP